MARGVYLEGSALGRRQVQPFPLTAHPPLLQVSSWVHVITLGGRQKWGKRQHAALPYVCTLVAVLRVGLGITQVL